MQITQRSISLTQPSMKPVDKAKACNVHKKSIILSNKLQCNNRTCNIYFKILQYILTMMLNVCQDLCNKIISYKIIVFYSFFTILWYFSLHCLQTYLLMSLLMKSIAIGSNLAISPLFTKRDVPCSLLSYF